MSKEECELCGKLRVCKDGLCNKCDKDLDAFIELGFSLLFGASILMEMQPCIEHMYNIASILQGKPV